VQSVEAVAVMMTATEPEPTTEIIPAVAPAAPPAPVASATCKVCGFAPRRGETTCRTCNASVEPIAPPVIDMAQPIAGVLAQIVAPHPSDTAETVKAEDLGAPAAGALPGGRRSRGKKATPHLNGSAT
jgi:hypothetical protein